jgi:hypothetical protein
VKSGRCTARLKVEQVSLNWTGFRRHQITGPRTVVRTAVGADIPDPMQPLSIIEPFNEHKDLSARLLPSVIRLVMDQFILQGAEEALGPSVVSRC